MILVTGANGFLGRHAVRALVAGGDRVRAMVRDLSGAKTLQEVECELVTGDVTDPESLARATQGCTTVVHLVAIIAGRRDDFERVIAEGTRSLVAAAREAGARRLVYVSALGANDPGAPEVPYFRAKSAAEDAVTGSGLEHVILRPTFVFGPDGGALPRFMRIARLAPVTPVVGAGTQRVQPIWVDDVARAIALAGQTVEPGFVAELGGPDAVDWNELWRRIKASLETRRPALHLPTWLMRAPAAVLERLPNPPVTRDQLTMLGGPDNVVSDEGRGMERLGLRLDELLTLDEQLRRAAAER
ncbi:MAG TPA: NAD(P)H-binding protein [Gaiella sp.]|jgi:NADH dehydrogenase